MLIAQVRDDDDQSRLAGELAGAPQRIGERVRVLVSVTGDPGLQLAAQRHHPGP